MNEKMERLSLTAIVGIFFLTTATVQGQEGGGLGNPDASVASIAGFSVVLSLLIISLCVVILLCACYGKCKLPCKSVYHTEQQETSLPHIQPRNSSRKNLIPLPSPKALTPPSFNNRMRSPVETQIHRSSLPPSNSFSSNVMAISSPQQSRNKATSNTSRTLPATTLNHNVIHLRQLNAESFQQLTASSGSNSGSLKVTQTQQKRSSLSRSNRQQGPDTVVPISPSHLQSLYVVPSLANTPSSETFIGDTYPYQAGKSLVKNTPQDIVRNPSGGGQAIPSTQPNVPIPYLSNVPLQIESPILETGDEGCSSTTFDTREHEDNQRLRSCTPVRSDETEREESRHPCTSPPPPYSTQV